MADMFEIRFLTRVVENLDEIAHFQLPRQGTNRRIMTHPSIQCTLIDLDSRMNLTHLGDTDVIQKNCHNCAGLCRLTNFKGPRKLP